MKIAVIGCGNMGGALVNGMLEKKVFNEPDVMLFDVDTPKAENLSKKWKTGTAKNMEEAVSFGDITLMAIKPQDMNEFMKKNAAVLDKAGRVLLTIAAGLKVSAYRDHLKNSPIARVMPNIPASVGQGAAGIYFDGAFTAEQKSKVIKIFEACGTADEVKKEDLLDVVTGLSGSGPAYVFAFINSLADAGVLEGLPRDTARRLAVQTVLGSSAMAAESLKDGVHLEELKDRVTSPGGTTAAGLFALEDGAFRGTVMKAVREAVKRSRELGAK